MPVTFVATTIKCIDFGFFPRSIIISFIFSHFFPDVILRALVSIRVKPFVMIKTVRVSALALQIRLNILFIVLVH